MLSRVEQSINEQRRFAADASHELRTPLAVMRTMLEVARADPHRRDLDTVLARLEETNERSIALIEALLALADIEHREPAFTDVDLDGLLQEMLEEVADAATRRGIRIETDLAAGAVEADPALLRQLIANLLQNALVHNHTGGGVWVATTLRERATTLVVANTGDILDPAIVPTLTKPFVRGDGRIRRSGARPAGSGLGLAIATAIADAIGAEMSFAAREGGGLIVDVAFSPQTGSRR